MAFDLSTAQPAQEPSGFDISTAQPFQPEEEPQSQPSARGPKSGALAQKNVMRDIEAQRAEEVKGLPEIGEHPMLSTLSGDALSREGLNLAIGFLSAPDNEFANIIKQNLPEAEVEQTELGNYIVTTPEGKFSLNKPGISTRDVESLLFKLGVSMPAGRTAATGLKAIGQVAAQEAAVEAVVQGAESAAGGEFTPEQVGLAGAFGLGGQAVGEGVSAVGRGVAGDIAPAQKEIIEAGKETNIPVLTSDVVDQTRAGKLTAQSGELVPFIGTGGARQAQQEGRTELAKTIDETFPFAGPEAVFDSLKRQTNKVKQAAGAARGNIVDQVSEVRSDLSNALPAINKELKRLQTLGSGKAKQAVDTETINALNQYKADIVNDRTFGGIEKLRTSFRENVQGERMVVPTHSKAAIDNIYKSITKDLDSIVGENLGEQGLRKWKKSNAVYADEARKLNKSRFKNVLDKGDITPEKVTDLLKSKKPSEISMLYKSLDNEGRKAGRASIISDATKRSMNEDGTMNPTKFLNELNKNKDATNIFFKGKDKGVLEGYKKLLGATRRGQEFTAAPPTGQTLIPVLAAGASFFRPEIIGAGLSAGALARAYESPVVRDFLLKVANTPAGSKKFDELLRSGMPAVNAAIVSSQEIADLSEEAK